jgi:xanthine dehydrogenase accessory factor
VTVDVAELARDRDRRNQPYVIATVVWRRAPSSGKPGSKALIDADGKVSGWLGGACSEPAVVREARLALADGKPRLMSLGPGDELGAETREGVVRAPISCQSEGALEIFLEPVLPAPELVAIGRSPAVDALVTMGGALGWRTVIVDDGGATADHPAADRVITELDLAAVPIGERSLVVVATQGHYDEPALEQALAAHPAYVGLVASRTRADAVLAYLRERGVDAESLGRVHAPAGLDLGGIDHEEIAVAILAELVALRAATPSAVGGAAGTADDELIDPVCGMAVAVESRHRTTHDGIEYRFCSAGCAASFEADPDRYATPSATRAAL